MTKGELAADLDQLFDKWKAYEYPIPGTIILKVDGPITHTLTGYFSDIVPAGVLIGFYTMGFWERLFCFRSGWRN